MDCAMQGGGRPACSGAALDDLTEDVIASVLELTCPGQETAMVLMLVNRRFASAGRSLACWDTLTWRQAAKSACRPEHGSAAFASLLLAIRRWLGSRVLCFDGAACPLTCHLLTDSVLGSVVATMPRLRSLRLRNCPRVTDVGLRAVAAAAPPLRAFAVEWCGTAVYRSGLTEVVRACPLLEEFAISCDQESRSLASVGDELALELAARCPAITRLQLSDTSVGDSGLAAVAQAYGPRLLALTLNYTTAWTAWGLQAVAQRCTRLREFSAACSGLTPRGLMMLALGCPALERLCVDRCPRVTLPALQRAMHAAPALRCVAMASAWKAAPAEERSEFERWAAARGWELSGPSFAVATRAVLPGQP